MDKAELGMTRFMNISLKILTAFILVGSAVYAIYLLVASPKYNFGRFLAINLSLAALCVATVLLAFKFLIRDKFGTRKALTVILVLAFLLRLSWMLAVRSLPFSDFELIFESGKYFADGELWIFQDANYLSRFSHLTVLTLYMGFLQKVFTNALWAVKIINLILSTWSVYLLFLIGRLLYDSETKGLWVALLASIYPPFILYVSVPCSENLAMPLFLASVHIFMMVVKGRRKIIWSAASGLLLSLGNLFRMVGPVMAVGFLLYLLLHWRRNKFIQAGSIFLVAFLAPLLLASNALMMADITENHLWKGREPGITSVLKGTNLDSFGMWNDEDGRLPDRYDYDYDAVKKASFEIIKERLTTTPPYKLLAFYLVKFTAQWSAGDFGGMHWSTGRIEGDDSISGWVREGLLYIQLFHILLIFLFVFGLREFKILDGKELINLFYIFFCGFGLLYLITEQQPRYGYIISWVFVVTGPAVAKRLRRTKLFKSVS